MMQGVTETGALGAPRVEPGDPSRYARLGLGLRDGVRPTLERAPLPVRARAPGERVGRESQAQREALRAIEMRGGRAHRRLGANGVRWTTIDADGRVTETLPTRTVEILAERGRLKLLSFGFDGEIYAIA